MKDRNRIALTAIAVLFATLAAVAFLPQTVTASEAGPRIRLGDIIVLSSMKAEAITKIGEQIVKKPATIELKITVMAVEGKTVKFKVDGGSITIDGVKYDIASGKGRLVRRDSKALLALGGEIKGPNDVSGGFRLEGVAGSVDDRVCSLLRSAIKVGEAVYRLRRVFLIRRA